MTTLKKAAGRFAEAEVDDEILLMRLDNGDFFALKETAAAIWRLIDGRRDREKLIAALAMDFRVEPHTIAEDVDGFLDKLAKAGFVVRS